MYVRDISTYLTSSSLSLSHCTRASLIFKRSLNFKCSAWLFWSHFAVLETFSFHSKVIFSKNPNQVGVHLPDQRTWYSLEINTQALLLSVEYIRTLKLRHYCSQCWHCLYMYLSILRREDFVCPRTFYQWRSVLSASSSLRSILGLVWPVTGTVLYVQLVECRVISIERGGRRLWNNLLGVVLTNLRPLPSVYCALGCVHLHCIASTRVCLLSVWVIWRRGAHPAVIEL